MLSRYSMLLRDGVAGRRMRDDDSQPTEKKETAEAPAAEQKAGCKDVEQPPPREDGGQKKPQKPLDPGKTYEVELTTSCGAFTIQLDQKTSPTRRRRSRPSRARGSSTTRSSTASSPGS